MKASRYLIIGLIAATAGLLAVACTQDQLKQASTAASVVQNATTSPVAQVVEAAVPASTPIIALVGLIAAAAGAVVKHLISAPTVAAGNTAQSVLANVANVAQTVAAIHTDPAVQKAIAPIMAALPPQYQGIAQTIDQGVTTATSVAQVAGSVAKLV